MNESVSAVGALGVVRLKAPPRSAAAVGFALSVGRAGRCTG